MNPLAGHMRTLALVSGSLRPTRPPATSTPDASRMGTALLTPTSEPKIRFPSTAASLHMALQNPKPVPLGGTHTAQNHSNTFHTESEGPTYSLMLGRRQRFRSVWCTVCPTVFTQHDRHIPITSWFSTYKEELLGGGPCETHRGRWTGHGGT